MHSFFVCFFSSLCSQRKLSYQSLCTEAQLVQYMYWYVLSISVSILSSWTFLLCWSVQFYESFLVHHCHSDHKGFSAKKKKHKTFENDCFRKGTYFFSKLWLWRSEDVCIQYPNESSTLLVHVRRPDRTTASTTACLGRVCTLSHLQTSHTTGLRTTRRCELERRSGRWWCWPQTTQLTSTPASAAWGDLLLIIVSRRLFILNYLSWKRTKLGIYWGFWTRRNPCLWLMDRDPLDDYGDEPSKQGIFLPVLVLDIVVELTVCLLSQQTMPLEKSSKKGILQLGCSVVGVPWEGRSTSSMDTSFLHGSSDSRRIALTVGSSFGEGEKELKAFPHFRSSHLMHDLLYFSFLRISGEWENKGINAKVSGWRWLSIVVRDRALHQLFSTHMPDICPQ